MRFFCTQPDIIEDAHDIRYQTKSSILPPKSSGSYHGHGYNGNGIVIPQNNGGQSGRSSADTGHHLATDIADSNSGLNRSRTSLSVFNGKKMFKRRGTIANPGPGIGNDSDLTSGSDGTPKKQKRSSHRISAPLNGIAGVGNLLHDQDNEPDQSKDQSKNKDKKDGNGYISGTDNEQKKRKRISKQHIGAPEGFRHEAHFGHGATFTKDGEPPDGWDVETWRAEIEKTFKPSDHPANRPRGPRPSGEMSQQQYQHYPPQVGRAATVGAGPKGRPMTAPERIPPPLVKPSSAGSGTNPPDIVNMGARTGDSSNAGAWAGRGHSHSKSYSGGHSRSRSPTEQGPDSHPSQTSSVSPLYAHLDAHVQAHALAQANALGGGNMGLNGYPPKFIQTHAKTPSSVTNGSLGSLGSSNFSSPTSAVSNSTYSTQPAITYNNASLSRSQSEKPYHPSHSHGHGQSRDHHHSSSYDFGKGSGNNNGSLGRSASATAALPPTLPPASSTSTQSYASSSSNLMRRPIPSQRRKPVPQHLPATVEVSPFPTMLLEPKEDGTMPIPEFPFSTSEYGHEGNETDDMTNRGNRRDDGARDSRDSRDARDSRDSRDGRNSSDRRDSRDRKLSKSKHREYTPKEMVPLLGVPGEEAHYVTKSIKARWDGNMAEIMNALKDEPAPPAIVKLPQRI